MFFLLDGQWTLVDGSMQIKCFFSLMAIKRRTREEQNFAEMLNWEYECLYCLD
jgi:hypothetical protein